MTAIGVWLAIVSASLLLVCGRVTRTVIEPAAAAVRASHGEGGRHGDHDRTGTVWVLNRDRGELAIFDAGSGAVVRTLPVGAGAHDICISERARKAYVTAEAIDRVTTIDTETLATGSIEVGPLPHHLEPSHDGRTIYVSLASHSTAPGAPQYAAIDTGDDSVTYTTTSHNPAARSHGVHPSAIGGRIYVAHDVGDGVTVVGAEPPVIALSIAGIPKAEEIVATRAGDRLWVSSRGDGTVKRIDLGTAPAGIVSVAVGVQPESVMLTPSERTLVASLRGSPASLAFVDTVTLKLIERVSIGGAGTFGDLAVITDDGRYVYATFDAGATGTGGVAVVDVPARKVVATWLYPGTGRTHGIWYSRTRMRF
jgi:DNA-binding beta-propeller fold protein YncE